MIFNFFVPYGPKNNVMVQHVDNTLMLDTSVTYKMCKICRCRYLNKTCFFFYIVVSDTTSGWSFRVYYFFVLEEVRWA